MKTNGKAINTPRSNGVTQEVALHCGVTQTRIDEPQRDAMAGTCGTRAMVKRARAITPLVKVARTRLDEP